MTEEVIETGDEKHIYLPPRPGYRCSRMQFRNGLVQDIDMQPEELDLVVESFLDDETQKTLRLRDPEYGEMFSIRRKQLDEELLCIFPRYIDNPAPQEGKRGNVVVAREIPNIPFPNQGREHERNRRRRALN